MCLDLPGIEGSIASILFSWNWGSDRGLNWDIRECTLEIRGVRMNVVDLDVLLHPPDHRDPEPSQPNSPQTGVFGRYMESYMQQLIENLNLKVFDIEIVFQNELVVAIESAALVSFGKNEACLSQQVSADGLSIYCRSSSDCKILDPFSYSASVKRTQGSRFHSFAHGLEIVGNQPTHSARLNPLSLGRLIPLLHRFCQSQTPGSQAANLLEDLGEVEATRFVLPLPDIVLCLSNDSRITFHQMDFSCTLDGSVCQFSGTRGVSFNGWPVVTICDGAKWYLDLIRHSFSMSREGFVDAAADTLDYPLILAEWSVPWKTDMLRDVLSAVDAVNEFVGAIPPANQTREASCLPYDAWHATLPGSVILKVKGGDSKWIALTLDSPRTVSCFPQSFDGAHIDQVILDSFSGIHMFARDVLLERTGLRVSGKLHCNCDSVAGITDGGAFLADELNLLSKFFFRDSETNEESDPERCSTTLPMLLRVPSVELTVVKESMKVLLEDIYACNIRNELYISHFQFMETCATGTVLAASNLAVDFRKKFAVSLRAIESLYIPGVCSITAPIHSVVVHGLCDERLKIIVPSVCLMLLEGSSNSTQNNNSPSAPCPIEIIVSSASIESESKRFAIVSDISIRLKSEGGIRFQAGFKRLESKMIQLQDFSVGGILCSRTIYGMVVCPGLISIGTDLSSFDWSLVLGTDKKMSPKKSVVWNIPNVEIDPFSIQISLQRDTLSTGKPHRVPAYKVITGCISFSENSHSTSVCSSGRADDNVRGFIRARLQSSFERVPSHLYKDDCTWRASNGPYSEGCGTFCGINNHRFCDWFCWGTYGNRQLKSNPVAR